jgi:hypothetical protein
VIIPAGCAWYIDGSQKKRAEPGWPRMRGEGSYQANVIRLRSASAVSNSSTKPTA